MRVLTALFLLPLALFASPERLFQQATASYNEGNFEEALETYNRIDAVSPQLDYNIGNTLMRLNLPAEALARYRRAQWLAPGDADIQANLARAVDVFEAPVPDLPLTRTLTGWWTPGTWQLALMTACWLTAGIGFCVTLLPRCRHIAFWTLPPAGVLLLITGIGTWASLPTHFTSEAVIKGPQGITRFEPLPDATEQNVLSGGSIVTIAERTRNWVRIETGDVSGWIQEDDLVQL